MAKKKNMHKKGFINIIIIGVITLIIASAGYFALTQKIAEAPATIQETESTKDWETYKNEEFNFEVKYPSNYKVGKLTGEGGDLTVPSPTFGTTILNPEAQTPASMPYVFIFEPATRDISHNPNAKNLLDYKNNYFTDDVRKVVIKSQEDIVINGLPAIKQFYNAGDAKERLNPSNFEPSFWNSPTTFDQYNLYKMSHGYESNFVRYIFFDGKYTFIILETEGKYEKFLDQIANSFKFNEDLTTQNWKTYRNEKYGIEFEYPNELAIKETFVQSYNKNSSPGSERHIIGIAIGNKNDLQQPLVKEGQLLYFGHKAKYFIVVSSTYCGTFDCPMYAFGSAYEREGYFSNKIIEQIINGFKVVIYRMGCYECYDGDERIGTDGIFALACNSSGDGCVRFSTGRVPVEDFDKAKNDFINQFLPTIKIYPEFENIQCTPVEITACAKG